MQKISLNFRQRDDVSTGTITGTGTIFFDKKIILTERQRDKGCPALPAPGKLQKITPHLVLERLRD